MSDIQQLRNQEDAVKKEIENLAAYKKDNVCSVQFLNLQRELKKVRTQIQNIMSGHTYDPNNNESA